ncbi:MAG: LysR family transcriptional regulator [Oribacterium sp.]|nr:LysR family transcriptional regulator [Oribacterium sp.]MBP3804784.1 LysR family transcriptional regulator [Oribacterium sp.]
MKDSDWRIINALHETQSITKIAAMMYKSQSAITKRLQIMEQELDCRIVERTPLGVVFTKEGEFLYKESVKHIEFENEVTEGLRLIKEQTKENIIIGSAYTYTKYTLYDALDDFVKSHHNVSIRVVNKQSDLLYNMLMEGKLDVAFIRSDYTENVYHELVDYTDGYIVSRNPVELSELPRMERIAYQTNIKTEQKISEWWQGQFGTEIPEATEDVGYIEFAYRTIASGDKYLLCFLPDNFINEFNLSLQPMLKPDGTRLSRKTWFIYKKEKNRRAIVDELIAYVDKNVKIR